MAMSAHTSQAYPGRHDALQSGRRPRKRTRRTHLTDCMPLANLQDRMWGHTHCQSIHHPTYRHTAHQSGQQPVQGPAALNESQTQSYDSYDSTIYRRVADAVIRLIRLNHLPMSRRRSHTTHTTQPSTDESQTQSYDLYNPTIDQWTAENTHTTRGRGRAYKEGLPPS